MLEYLSNKGGMQMRPTEYQGAMAMLGMVREWLVDDDFKDLSPEEQNAVRIIESVLEEVVLREV